MKINEKSAIIRLQVYEILAIRIQSYSSTYLIHFQEKCDVNYRYKAASCTLGSIRWDGGRYASPVTARTSHNNVPLKMFPSGNYFFLTRSFYVRMITLNLSEYLFFGSYENNCICPFATCLIGLILIVSLISESLRKLR